MAACCTSDISFHLLRRSNLRGRLPGVHGGAGLAKLPNPAPEAPLSPSLHERD